MGRFAVLFIPLLAACAGRYAAEAPGEMDPDDVGVDLRSRTFGTIAESVRDYDVQIATAAVALDPFHRIPRINLTVAGAATPDPISAPSPEAPPERQDRQVIYTGSLALQVPDPEGIELEVATIAKGFGGWVSKIERPRIVLRVPATRFEEAVKALSALGQVLDRKIAGQDVTDQFRDFRIRLENAEKVRVRLSALLEQAKTVQDALAVEKELGRVTEEIERLKGQIAAMSDQVAFSSITLELRRSLPLAARQRRFPFPWVYRLGAEMLLRF